MVSQKQYDALKNASDCYLSHGDFGVPDIEFIRNEVFGSERTGDEAVSWTCYWNKLNVYEERLRATRDGGGVPMVHAEFSSI
jgi:hypothetical protein